MSHDGHVIVRDTKQVSIYDTTYQLIHKFDTTCIGGGVAVNREGDIYVANLDDGIVLF